MTHEQMVSNNGAGFMSDEFKQFTQCNGIKHVFALPYHPSSNGLALMALLSSKIQSRTEWHSFLFHYHITPQTTIRLSSA